MTLAVIACCVLGFALSLQGCSFGGNGATQAPDITTPAPPPRPVLGKIDNFRVAKAMHARGYNKVRISVVDDGSGNFGDFFDYNQPFAFIWTSYHLHSTIKDVAEGGSTFSIGGHNVTVKIPNEGSKTRGLLLADPCFSSRDTNCPFGGRFQVFDRLKAIADDLVASDEIDYWGIIGDNFYESKFPSLSAQFFEAISLQAKAKPLVAVPGNHDYWIAGGPPGQGSDQFGYGFLQMYGQDTEASLLNGTVPYDFSVPPQIGKPGDATFGLPRQENFIFNHQIGDVAILGWTGASTWELFAPFAKKFCDAMEDAPTVNTVLLLGHWNQDDLGCFNHLATPDVYAQLKSMAGCSRKTVLYVDGHRHCNEVTEPEHGFMIGGNGMVGCNQFGFLVLESNPHANGGPGSRVDYFELANGGLDTFDVVHSCLKTGRFTDCRDAHAKPWRRMSGRQNNNFAI